MHSVGVGKVDFFGNNDVRKLVLRVHQSEKEFVQNYDEHHGHKSSGDRSFGT